MPRRLTARRQGAEQCTGECAVSRTACSSPRREAVSVWRGTVSRVARHRPRAARLPGLHGTAVVYGCAGTRPVRLSGCGARCALVWRWTGSGPSRCASRVPFHTRTLTRASARTLTNNPSHSRTIACAFAHTHSCMHTCTQAGTHTRTHTHTHTRVYAHAHTCTCMRT